MSRNDRSNRAPLRTLALALALTVVAATPAAAQTALNGYSGKGPAVQQQVQGQSEARPDNGSGTAPGAAGTRDADTSQGALPFTGMDLALAGGLGIALLGLGVGMRALARPTREVG